VFFSIVRCNPIQKGRLYLLATSYTEGNELESKEQYTPDKNPLLSYAGDINYRKERLTHNNIMTALSQIADPLVKLDYIEATFQAILLNKTDQGSYLYNERNQFRFKTSQGIFNTAQMHDIWNLKLAYLEIALSIEPEANETFNRLMLRIDSLLDFDQGSWLPGNKRIIDAKQAFNNLINGHTQDLRNFLSEYKLTEISPLRTELHWDIMQAMNALGYPANSKGVCFGLVGLAVQQELGRKLEVLDELLDPLFTIPLTEFQEEIKTIRDKQNIIPLNHEEVDTRSLFDGISTYANPDKHAEIFQEDEFLTQDIKLSQQVAAPADFLATGGAEELIPPSGFEAFGYDVRDRNGYFFASLKYLLEINGLNTQPLAFRLRIKEHSIFVGYDPSKSCWDYLDISLLPRKSTQDVTELARWISETQIHLLYHASKKPVPARNLGFYQFSPNLYVNQSMANEFQQKLNTWLDFWYAGKTYTDLAKLLLDIPKEERIKFIEEKIGLHHIQLMQVREPYADYFVRFLSAIAKVLPENDFAYFMGHILDQEEVQALVRRGNNYEIIVDRLTEGQKKLFVQIFQLEKLESDRQAKPGYIYTYEWNRSKDQPIEDRILLLLKTFIKHTPRKQGIFKAFAFWSEDEVSAVTKLCVNYKNKTAQEIFQELKKIQSTYPESDDLRIIVDLLKKEVSVKPERPSLPTNE
jgi:hypothetical protein